MNQSDMGAVSVPIAIAPKPGEPLQDDPPPQLASSTTTGGESSSTPSSHFQDFLQANDGEQYRSPYAAGQQDVAAPIPAQAFSKETSEVIARVKANGVQGLMHGSSEWETAKQAVKAEMDSLTNNSGVSSTNPSAARTGGRRGRGPRRRGSPAASGTIILTPSSTNHSSTPPSSRGRYRNRGGQSRSSRGGRASTSSGKRKREHGSDSDNDMSSSSVEITALPPQSRSGRKIFQASIGTPIIKLDPDTTQSSSLTLSNVPLASPSKGTNVKKKSVRRTPGASAVCKNCGRGHSPLSNAIVFCDGCNTPWHQYCHDPPIKPEYLLIAEKEWFCADCIILREDRVKLVGKVAGDGMSLLEKRKYLRSLSSSTLVSLLIHASSLYPALPIFPPKVTQFVNSEDGSLVIYEDNELPYPKAGNGIPLPPESADLSILLDEDTVTYSHQWQGLAQMIKDASRRVKGINGSGSGGFSNGEVGPGPAGTTATKTPSPNRRPVLS